MRRWGELWRGAAVANLKTLGLDPLMGSKE